MNCNEWNSFVEEASTPLKLVRKSGGIASKLNAIALNDVDTIADIRFVSGMDEFDRVLGGGIVTGSVILLGGDPGIGKSTLMMQVALHLKEKVILYVTGEESIEQIKNRADRLKISDGFHVVSETNLENILEVVKK